MESKRDYDFSLLPPHIIAQVFTNLKFRECLRASQTCKSWYFASCDPIISRNMCVRIASYKKMSRFESFNRPFGKVILSIDFDKFRYQDFLQKFAQQLHHVVFYWCELSIEQLVDCIGYLTNLTKLEFTGQKYSFVTPSAAKPNINDTAIELLTQNLRSVIFFCVETESINYSGLRLILFRMINLETIQYTTINSPEFEALIDYIKQFDNLKLRHLELGYKIDAEFFRSFATVKTKLNLHSLKIRTIDEEYYNSDFEIFCQKLANLKVLSTTANENQLIDVCRYMTNLVELILVISNTQKFRYVRTLQTLKKLVMVSNIYSHNEDNDEELFQFLSMPLVNLQELHITYRMSPTVLEILCENYKHLNGLKLTGLTSFNVEAIYKNLVNLKSLELYFSIYLAPDLKVDMECDITNLKLLEELDISISIPGATWDLIKQLPNLKLATKQMLEIKLNSGHVDPQDEITFSLVQNLFD